MTRLFGTLIFTILIIHYTSCYCKNSTHHFDAKSENCTSELPPELTFISNEINTIIIDSELCKTEFANGSGDGENIIYQANGLYHSQYFFITCGDTNGDYKVVPGRYFNVKSCCANLNKYFDFDSETCEAIRTTPGLLIDYPELKQFNITEKEENKWISNQTNIYNDYKVLLSDIVSDKNVVQIKVDNKKQYRIDISKDNNNYCLDRMNDNIFLRLSSENDCNNNDACIRQCWRDDDNSKVIYNILHKINSTDLNAIKDFISNTSDIVLLEEIDCPRGYTELEYSWEMYSNGDLMIDQNNLTIKKEDYCFEQNDKSLKVYVCQDKSLEIYCKNHKCINKCSNFEDYDSFWNSFKRWFGSEEILNAILIKADNHSDLENGIEVNKRCPYGSTKTKGSWTFAENGDVFLIDENITVSEYCISELTKDSAEDMGLHYCRDSYTIFNAELDNGFTIAFITLCSFYLLILIVLSSWIIVRYFFKRNRGLTYIVNHQT